MLLARRQLVLYAGTASLTLLLCALLPNWSWPPNPAHFGHSSRIAAAAVAVTSSHRPRTDITPRDDIVRACPPGRLVTINPTGRLGNKLCQYATLWALQLADDSARPAWILPEMHSALASLFSGLTLPVLPPACARLRRQFWTVSYFRYDLDGPGPPGRPIFLADHPCSLTLFNRYRAALLEQLTFRKEVRDEAQRRLRRHTAPLCSDPQQPACTYIGVHVRRTDYGPQLLRMYNGTLAGERYLTRALALCRQRYRRPVFVASSDDLDWVRRRLRGPDVVVAGSQGLDAAGRDLALLAHCNHTVMTHGTFGFMAAFLARGDVVVPTGFGSRDSYLAVQMRQSGFNLTAVHV